MQCSIGNITSIFIIALLISAGPSQFYFGNTESNTENINSLTIADQESLAGGSESDLNGDNPGNSKSRAISSNDLIWPMFGKDKHHTFIANPTSKGIYTPAETWSSGLQIDSLGSAIGNFSSNIFGLYDRNVNFVVYADDGTVYILDGGSGDSVWQLDVDLIDSVQDNDQVYTSPAIGDLNKNGKMDVVFAVDDAQNNSYVYTYEPVITYNETGYHWAANNYASEQLWNYKTGVDMSFSSPVLADLDGNGNLDVVIGGAASPAKVFAINGKDGTALNNNWPYDVSGTRTSTPAIYEFGSNSRVVVTSIDPDTYYVYVISDKGQTLHQKSIDMNLPIGLVYSVVPSPAVGQLNRSSSNAEIVVLVPIITSVGRVYCLANDLTTLWNTTYTAGQFEASPALVDIDKDPNGDLDVVVASWDSLGTHLYAIEGRTGKRIWEQYKSLGVGVQNIIASPALVDVNIDNYVDAVFVAKDQLFALNGTNGGYLWNSTLPSTTGTRFVRSSPSIGNIDKDKFLDIFVDGSLISHYIIDLTLSKDDIEFSESELIQGHELTITAVIHNTGQAEAVEVVISFLENGNYITNTTIDSIPGGDTRGATIQWTPEEAGDVDFTIKIDPDNSIEEIAENNNEVVLKLDIIPAFPDLTLDELKFYRGDGKHIDNINTHLIENEESRVAAVVHNIGGLWAENVIVRFREGAVNLGVDQIIGFMGVNKSTEVGLNWTPGMGYHGIEALVDPLDGIVEANETNNNIREDGLFVKSNDPGDASFVISGKVLKPDGKTPVDTAQFIFTNERTKNSLNGLTDSTGMYNRDLKDTTGKYLEGDYISLFFTDGSNESSFRFKVYSEDKSRYDDVVLTSLPRYSVALSVMDDSLELEPGGVVAFTLSVENRGNTNNTINLNHTEVFDVATGLPAVNWTVNLDAYSADDLPAGKSIERILTVRAPSKSSEAQAGQVVRVKVRAVSLHDPSQTDDVTVYASVTRKYSIVMDIKPTFLKLDPAITSVASFTLNLTNFGNGNDRVSILVSDVTLNVNTIDVATKVELDPGEMVSTPLNLHIDSNHPPGLYSLTVQVESEDGNITSPRVLTVQIVIPDLSISRTDIELPSRLPEIGKTITITARIHNNGTAPASFVEVSLEEDGSIVASKVIETLFENSVRSISMTFVLGRAGKYNMDLILDPNNIIQESNEENNYVSFEFAIFPDLGFIGNFEISPLNPWEDDKVTLKVVVLNDGEVTVSSKFFVEFYYIKDETRWSIDKVEVSTQLRKGASTDVSTEWTARRDISRIYCMVDSSRIITERNEGDNEIMVNFTVSKKLIKDDEGSNMGYIILGGIVLVIIILLAMYFMFIPPRDTEEEEKEKDPRTSIEKSKAGGERKAPISTASKEKAKKAGEKRGKGGPKESPRAGAKSGEEEETEADSSDIMGTVVGGIKGLNPFAAPKPRKVKKVKRSRPTEAAEVKAVEDKITPERIRRERRKETLDKVRKADRFIKARELNDKEQQLATRSEILTKREKDIRTLKNELVEIGILEDDLLDELEKEELEELEKKEEKETPVEVEPLD
jgi:outer membrane protein assembly factor BamB